jgi:hypothetical protein
MAKGIKTVELFLAFSIASVVGTQALPAHADETDKNTADETHLLMTQGGEGEGGESAEGGEGGEGGEGAVSSGDPEVDYMTVLGLMKGHLMAAQELITAKNYEQAEPHIGHPVEELYSDIETVLPAKGVKDFKPTLNQLHDLIKSAPNAPEVQSLLDQSLVSIDEAITAIPEEKRNSSEFILSSMVEMLKTAATEYEAAIINNQFVEIVEYQDSRGFVFYCDELYQTIAQSKSQADPEGHQVITDTLAELKTAWPTIEPPDAPIKEPSEIYSLVSQIEFNK